MLVRVLMSVELGHLAAILALVLALAQAMVFCQNNILTRSLGGVSSSLGLQGVLNRLCLLEFLLLTLSVLTLWVAFLQHDFSVAVVYAHSHHNLPWGYRLSALWGGHEGSVLLWVWLLCGWRLAFARWSGFDTEDRLAIHAVLALVSLGIMAFLLFASNPFARILPLAPVEGNDLNPLLQDVGMATHPPILYFGYVAFAIPYACAMVMLWRKRLINNWAKHLRVWVLLAWSALTVGIVLGSWWAYRELGWGGWWFWDPVENASLMPWLAGLILLHGLALAQKQQRGQLWTILVALMAFILSLMGTFLVRSGVLISVHSFAQDPGRGLWILALIALYGLLALGLYGSRAHGMVESKRLPLLNRSGAVLANQILFAVMLFTVLLGTLYPMLVDALGLGKLSVGAAYFNSVMPWFCLPLLCLLSLLPILSWRSTSVCVPYKSLLAAFCAMGVSLWVIMWLKVHPGHGFAWFMAGLSLFAMFFTLFYAGRQMWQRTLSWNAVAMNVAHLGFLGMVLSIAVASSQSIEMTVALKPGEHVVLFDHQIAYLDTKAIQGKNYHGVQADMVISSGDNKAHYYPERRIYDASKINLAKTAMMVRPGYDIYLAMGEPLQEQAWSFRIQYKPMIRGIWLFGLMMALGGALAVWARRRLADAN
jgi:cytochrome c-type biogenesis protein CcmF